MISTINKLHKAYKHSWNGLQAAWKSQWAFRFELLILIVAIPCAYIIANSLTEFVLLISSVIILLIVELLNTAIETVVNRISFDYHELSGLAKDFASAALLISALNAILIWGIIFLEYICTLFH